MDSLQLMAQKLEGLGIDEEEADRGRMKKAGRCNPELGRQAQTEQKEVAGDDAGLNDLNFVYGKAMQCFV